MRGPWLLYAYVTSLAAAFVAVAVFAVAQGTSLLGSVGPWIALTAMFAGAEYGAVLFHDSKFRFGISASEAILMPMLVGLSFPQVVLGASVGMAIARAASRSRSPSKEIFNVSQFGLAAAGADVVWSVLSDRSAALSIQDIGAALAAVVAFVVATHIMFSIAMAASRHDSLRNGLKEFGFAETASLGASLLIGVFFTTAYVAAPWTVALFPLALAAVSFGYRALVRQAGEKERLAQLHAASQVLSATPDLGPALREFMSSVAEAVSATSARAVIEIHDQRVWSGIEGDVVVADLIPLDRATEVLFDAVAEASAPVCLTSGDDIHVGEAGSIVIAAPITANDRVTGCLVAYGRIGADEFDQSDATLLGALAQELALAVEAHALFHDVEEERERFELLVDAVQDYAIYMSDSDGFVASWNAGAARILGYEQSEIVGQHVSRLYPIEAEHGTWERESRTAEAGKWEGEGWRIRKDGTRFLAHITKTPVKDPNGKLRGFATVIRDVTERVAAERERNALETQLHQAQKLETVGRLAGGIAHDFNNLLGVILNYSRFVIDELGEKSPISEDVEEIKGAAERAVSLTRQLLIFSRREVPDPQVVDLNEVVSGFARLLQRSLGEDVLMELDLAPKVPRIKADVGQLEQVLMNLAVNARDAMQGGGTLKIATTGVDVKSWVARPDGLDGDGFALLTVGDTGCGMSRDVLDKMYEPFFTTKPKGIGTGLGLSTVHGIVTQAGGHIEIDTREGAGTTFRIFLPATHDEPTETEDAEEIEGGTGTQTVLLCEDQDVVRKMTARILENNGYTVLQARNGADALEVMRGHQERIDLLLSDVVMPHMSGMELGRRVADAFPEVRILYMSGYSNEVVSARQLDHETPPVISKPFAPETLLSRVHEALEG